MKFTGFLMLTTEHQTLVDFDIMPICT